MSRLIDLTGQKFGRLTVIKRAENKGRSVCWLCKCECGNSHIVRGYSLTSGASTSCGCYGKEMVSKTSRADLVGKKFGRLTVMSLSHVKKQSTYWLCQCTCGATKVVNVRELNSGHTRSCGCLQREVVIKKNIENTKGTTQILRYLRSLGVVEEWKKIVGNKLTTLAN